MKDSIRTEIIAVGTELLLGQIANTNAQFMSEQLAAHGINTYFHTVVGDNLDRLTKLMQQASERSNVIIISGGLGPTEDDLSREAFQQISNLQIVEHEASLVKIEKFYQEMNLEMTPNNRRQARIFKDSLVLMNKYGMAPGNIVQYDGKHWIFIPGVPREMKQIFTDEVIPYLKKLNGDMIIQSLVLRFFGIGESALEHQLQALIQAQSNPTIAPLAQNDGVTIRLTAKAKTAGEVNQLLAETKAKILQEVGEYYYGENDETIEEKVYALLLEKNRWLAAAESLTGGFFQSKLVSVSNISQVFKGGVVSYAADAKINALNVKEATITEHGTVSEACALEMARNVCHLMDATIGISFTGVAGPNETEGKKAGTVYIGLYDRLTNQETAQQFLFNGNRKQIRYRAVLKGFEILLQHLKNL